MTAGAAANPVIRLTAGPPAGGNAVLAAPPARQRADGPGAAREECACPSIFNL